MTASKEFTLSGLGLHRKQAEVFRDRSRFRVVVAGRRWGKSKMTAAELIRAASKPRQLVWYVAPTYRMAKQIMWIELMELIPRSYIVKSNETSLEIHLINKSRICLKGADKPDTLRGVGINFLAMDEVQDIRPEVWEVVLRPTLADTRGSAIFVGCVRGDTLVLPREGMTPIEGFSIGSPEKTLDPMRRDFYGLGHRFHEADGFWNNGIVTTRRVRTHTGFELEASLEHPVLVMGEDGIPVWRRMNELRKGDRVAIDRGMEVWGERDPLDGWLARVERLRAAGWGSALQNTAIAGMDEDLAYFLGLWTAEGSVDTFGRQNRVTITCGDQSVGAFLCSGRVAGIRFKPVKGRDDQWRCDSRELVELMRHLGVPLVKAPEKRIPAWVFQGRREWAQAFLAGLWDGDGHCLANGAVRAGFGSASPGLVRDVQLLMSNFGIIGRITTHETPPTARVRVASTQHRYTLTGANVTRFAATIPLRITRKAMALAGMKLPRWSRRDGVPHQGALLERVRKGLPWRDRALALSRNAIAAIRYQGSDVSYDTLGEIVLSHGHTGDQDAFQALVNNHAAGYYWDEVAELHEGEALTYDFTIPETHSFWSNGFISHNTPKAFNHLHKLFELGQNPKMRGIWRSWQFPTITSPFIPISEIEAARADMDERSFRQEFEATFESMSGRVYYNFSRRAHVDDRCVFNPKLPIWIGQDFNVDPMSSVILQPQPNGEVWAVDEIHLSSSNTQEVCDEIERRYWRHTRQITFFPDPAGASRSTKGRGESDLDILRERGFIRMRYRRKHPPVADRVNSVNKMLRTADGAVRLKISPRCRHLIESLEKTLYKRGTSEVDKSLGTEHMADALGYCMEMQFPRRAFEPGGVSL